MPNTSLASAEHDRIAPAAHFSSRGLPAIRPIRTLVLACNVEARSQLVSILQANSTMTVVGWGNSDLTGATLVRRLLPDVVIVEVCGQLSNGIDTITDIMAHAPTRVVVIMPSHETTAAERAMSVVRAGALAVIPGPGDPGSEGYAANCLSVRDVVRAAATVRLAKSPTSKLHESTAEYSAQLPHVATGIAVVAWAPEAEDALRPVLNVLAGRCPAPVVVTVDDPGHARTVVQMLSHVGRRAVVLAREPTPLIEGQVHVIVGNAEVRPLAGQREIVPLDSGGADKGRLFDSILEQFGSRALAVMPASWQGEWILVGSRWAQAGGLLLAASQEPRLRRGDQPLGPTLASVADLALAGAVLANHLAKYLRSQSNEVRR